MIPNVFILLATLLTLLPGSFACDPVSSGVLTAGGSSLMSSASAALNSAIDELHSAVDQQRTKLKADTLEIVEETELSAGRLAASTGAMAEALEERTANDLKANIDRATATLRELTGAVKTGVDESIRQAAQQGKVLLDQSHAIVRDALENMRPLIAQAKSAGDELVWRTEGALSTLLLRVLAGALVLLAAIPVVWVFVARKETDAKGRSLAVFGVGAAVGLVLFIFAPNLSALTASEHRVPNFEQQCLTMEQHGPELMARSANNQTIPKELATKVREAALTCQTFSSNATQAASAERYVLAALRASGAAAVCRASWQCPAEHVCETSTGECLRYGVYCTTPQHCDTGSECDVGRHRCVPRDNFACSGADSCQNDEACHERHCVLLSRQVGKPCRVDGAHGICDAGSYQSDGRGGLLCKSTKQAAREVCNGLDDDCNGTIDDAPVTRERCVADTAKGVCRSQGTSMCRDGKVVCVPGDPRPEKCDNEVDENCDGYLNDGCRETQFMKQDFAFPAPSNCGERTFGGACPSGHVRARCEVIGPNTRDTWMKTRWATADPHDCTCRMWCNKNWTESYTWSVKILSHPEQRPAPR